VEKPRRQALEILLFFLLSAAAALLVNPLGNAVCRYMNAARLSLIARGESILGRKIFYSSLGPSVISKIDLRGFSIENPSSTLVSVSRLTIQYSLFDLVRIRKTGAVRYMLLETPVINFDVDEDRDLGELFSGRGGFIMPPQCIVRVQDGKLSLVKNRVALEIDNFSFDGAIKDGRVALSGRWHTEADSPTGDTVTFNGGMEGDFAGDLSSGGLVFSADQIQGPGFIIEPLRFTVAFDGAHIDVSKTEDGRPLLFNARYDLEQKTFSVLLKNSNVVLGSLVRFRGPWKRYEELLDTVINGEFSFTYDDRALYRFNLQGRNHENTENKFQMFSLAGSGSDTFVNFDECYVDFYRGRAAYNGNIGFGASGVRLMGSLLIDRVSLTGDRFVSGRLIFRRSRNGSGFSANLQAGSRYYSFSGRADWEGPLCTFDGVFFRRPAGEYGDFTEPGGFNFTGTYRSGGSRDSSPQEAFQMTVDFLAFTSADILALGGAFFPLPSPDSPAGGLRISSSVLVNAGGGGFSYRTPVFVAELNNNSFRAQFSGTERSFILDEGLLDGNWGRAGLSARFDFGGAVRGDIRFAYEDYVWDLHASLSNQFINVSANESFYLSLRNNDTVWSGSVLGSLPVPFKGRRSFLEMDGAFRYTGPASWQAELRRLRLNNPVENLLLQGQANERGLSLSRIFYEDAAGPLEGALQAAYTPDFSVIEASMLVEDEEKLESYSAQLEYDKYGGGDSVEFQGSVFGSRLERFFGAARGAVLSGELRGVYNRSGYYSVTASIASLSGRRGENSYNIDAMIFTDNERAVLSGLYGSFGEMDIEIPYFTLDRSAGHLETEVRLSGQLNERSLGMDTVVNANFMPPGSWLGISRAISEFSGVVELRNAFIDETVASEPLSFVFSRTRTVPAGPDDSGGGPHVLRVSGGPDDCFRFEWQEDGPFVANLSNPSPVQASVSGILQGTTIDAFASGVYIDLPRLWSLIPVREVVNFKGGFITGETAVTGSIFDPEFNGLAWGSAIALSVPGYIDDVIGPGSGEILIEGNEFSFGPVSARCGTGEGTVDGWFRFNRWVPTVSININANKAIPFNFNVMGVIARGNATGNISLLVENKETLTISGDLNADDTDLMLNTDELGRTGENRITDLDVITDVSITAGRRVEFLWPNADTPIIRAYADAGTRIRIIGDTRVPLLALDGDLALRGGEIFYLQRNFYIREGRVTFNRNDPEINPRISARAEIRDRNEDGPVIIAMVVENQPLSTLATSAVRLESSPALSQREIYELLGQSPAGTSETGEVLVSTVSELIAQFALVRRVEQQIRGFLHLDMFSVRTQVLQNALFGAMRSQEPDRPRPGPGNYWDNTAIMAGKYIESNIFLHGLIAFRYDEYRERYGGLRLEPEFGLDLRSPYFDIRYRIQPEHIENLFINDQSLSIIWRWTL
jgi:hypothetical protein